MFGWVDFSQKERDRAAQIMQLAKSEGSIDELGIGVLRDRLADQLFPGTSTLHTHVRYYFFTAYQMLDIEASHAGRGIAAVRAACTHAEKETARRLLAHYAACGNPGVTGITGRDFAHTDRWVKQTPSMMNWAALSEYGILADDKLKLGGCLAQIANLARPAGDHYAEEDDPALVFSNKLWNVPPRCYRLWREGEELSFDLMPEEAEQMKDAICSKHPESLYAALVEFPDRIEAIKQGTGKNGFEQQCFVQLVEHADSLLPGISAETRQLCEASAALSALVALLHIRFNLIIDYRCNRVDHAAALWEQELDADGLYRRWASRCNLDDIAGRAHVGKSDGHRVISFLKGARKALLDNNEDELDELIVEREWMLKHGRSKIAQASVYAGKWYGGIELTYRLGYALRFAGEISDALSHVEPRSDGAINAWEEATL